MKAKQNFSLFLKSFVLCMSYLLFWGQLYVEISHLIYWWELYTYKFKIKQRIVKEIINLGECFFNFNRSIGILYVLSGTINCSI